MADNINFRYLNIRDGYQKGSQFDGYKTTGYWIVDQILHNQNGVDVDVTEEGLYMYSGTSTDVRVTISRFSFTDVINFVFIGLPQSITASYTPVSDKQIIVTLTCSDSVSSTSARYDITATGSPIPARNKKFSLYTDFGWKVGQIRQET